MTNDTGPHICTGNHHCLENKLEMKTYEEYVHWENISVLVMKKTLDPNFTPPNIQHLKLQDENMIHILWW